ncbi:alpha-E domain-containing protein [Thiomicrorhabdus sp.]|uniref:alpha-E domain-containing protein n=1 Tax=Thiomicrorhabdus sp. TaxID=2039724 RepID=UPI0029C86E05|nr:alpha-E domain-containing protein [Thiomicrorhabdus sp.]
MKMLLCDLDNPASLIASLWWARENTRTTRDILPREAWIHINELYLMVKAREGDFKTRSKRNELLKEIIRSCQAWSGMLAGTMSQNDTYRFIKLGMSIERADMTSRLLDVGGLFIAQETLPGEEHAFDSVLWAHLLKSSSAYFMYRQKFQTEISGQQVIDFLIQDEDFARALLFNIGIIERTALKLPHGENLNPQIEALKAALLQSKDYQVGSLDLHNYLDRIQIKLSALHSEFYHLWFNPKEVA